MDLAAALPLLLPSAIAWAEEQARKAETIGTALPPDLVKLAVQVGVQHPERIRLVVSDALPMPEERALAEAASQAGLLGPDMVGLTLGYAVFIRRGHASARLLRHEFRHVQQFEAHGSLAGFLGEYLGQIVRHGYRDSPYEQDARAHEAG